LAASKRSGDGVDVVVPDTEGPGEGWLQGLQLPSWESLMALLWALQCEERKQRSDESRRDPVTNIHSSTTNHSIGTFHKVQGYGKGKRKQEGVDMFAELGESKRRRWD
jgi:hypothetical protein